MKLKHLFAASALAASTTLSFADVTVAVPLNPTGPDLFGAVFTPTTTGFFVDTFEFAALPSASTVFVSLFNLFDSVEFSVVSIETDLSSQSIGFDPMIERVDQVTFEATVAANTPFRLVVLGAATALGTDGFPVGPVTYGGALIAAVPEPETYAMLLAGLVGVAGAASRKRRAQTAAIA